MASEQEELTQDVVFDILSSSRRRYVLFYLRQADEPVELNDLAEHVAAWENELPVEELSDQQRKRVYVSLYQTHVPKLDSIGLVDHDQQSGLVELTDRAHEIDSYLTVSTSDVPWQQFYLGLALVSAAMLTLVWLSVGPFAAIPEVAVGVGITVAFAVSAIGHYLYRRQERQRIPRELERNR
ncbi:DUF7344 domain-containing protein [Halorientalis litorea]|jgi:hypothetical protein|uniref:DUF7344 domain-containing protein n=1 Tax=Halorientalis litorea TaxID=2931977 RepID=UPI001FF20CA9|nr:hypothetical protein [Halorientalis litorea]